MGIKIKNLQTGEFEKFNIPALKGEKGEPGEIEPSEKVDYIGKQHSKLRDTMNANVDYIIKTAIGEFNYLDYEGQHITATNTIEGRSKSAILKGQTKYRDEDGDVHDSFVQIPNEGNLYKGTRDFNTTYWEFGAGAKPLEPFELDPNFKQATLTSDYQHVTTPTSKQGFMFNNPNKTWTISAMFKGSQEGQTIGITLDAERMEYDKKPVANGQWTRITWTFQGSSTLQKFRFENKSLRGTIKVAQVMVTETDHAVDWKPALQDGEYKSLELISCKMPVLTTTGKNLFDKEAFYNDWKSKQPTYMYKEIVDGEEVLKINNLNLLWEDEKGFKIPVEKGIPLTLTLKCKKAGSSSTNAIFLVRYGDSSVSTVGRCVSDNWESLKTTFTPTRNYITICSGYNNNDYYYIKDIQLEKGSTATSHEPYKSNILTVNEDVELQGIGEVQDTLDLMTGEIVSNFATYTFNGSEKFTDNKTSDSHVCFGFHVNNIPTLDTSKSIGLSKDIPYQNWLGDYPDKELIYVKWAMVYVSVSKDKLISHDVDGLKTFLKEKYETGNPISFIYPLYEKPIKTVDLSDNHVYSYDGTTHYSCGSEEGSLVPTLSVKVPTDTQLTIQEQKATTQTLLIKNMDLQQSIKEVQAMNLAFNTALYNSFNSIREEVEDIKKHVSTNENLEGSF